MKSPPSWQAPQETKSAKIMTLPSYNAKNLQGWKKNDIQVSSEKIQTFPADAVSKLKTCQLKGEKMSGP